MDCSWEIDKFIQTFQQLPPELLFSLQQGPNSAFLNELSVAALESALTGRIFTIFEPLSIEICARWKQSREVVVIPALGRILRCLPHLSDVAQFCLSSLTNSDLLSVLFKENNLLDGLDPVLSTSDVREVLLGLYRLLEVDNGSFTKFIRPATIQIFLHHDDRPIRYLAIRLICQWLRAADAVMEKMISKYLGSGPVVGMWEGKTIDYLFLTLWERRRFHELRHNLESVREERTSAFFQRSMKRVILQDDLSPAVIEINGVLFLRSAGNIVADNAGSAFIATPTTVSNMQNLSKALLTLDPVLITGPASSGKTTLVREIATRLNMTKSMVTLHLNEQSDAKLLIGIYSTGSQAGSFEWKPGVLTNAVKEGRWLFIEDLDRAPNDIISVLLPLMERRELAIPSRGETLRAARGFRIIATMRSSRNLQGTESISISKMVGQRLWKHVTLQAPAADDVNCIIMTRHPLLERHLTRIDAVYDRLSQETSHGASSSSRTRSIFTRELFRWCARFSDRLQGAGLSTGHEPVPEAVIDAIFLDAVDCFTGNLENGPLRMSLIASIAAELHVAPQRRDYLLHDRCPTLKSGSAQAKGVCNVGRARLSLSSQTRPPGRNANEKDTGLFALNTYSLCLLEQVAVAVERREPLLLVGETGIGKTTVIQHVARITGQHLLAINLSQQSESGDLLGGFKPVNMRSLIIPLKDEFDALFYSTFSRKRNQDWLETVSKFIAKGQWKRTLEFWRRALDMANKAFKDADEEALKIKRSIDEQPSKKRKVKTATGPDNRKKWTEFAAKVASLDARLTSSPDASIFSFVEGKLVNAVRDGHWVLLDEINLATSDTLECLVELLESGPSTHPSIQLTESGNVERIQAHKDFRIFAAMNPATDVGKKDLPLGIRSRFTEIYVNSPDKDAQSLRSIVKLYLDRSGPSGSDKKLISAVTELYQEIQSRVKDAGLVDGSGQRPHYSLRTLTRALAHAVATAPQCTIRRALFEGFAMCFFTPLDDASEEKLQVLVRSKLFTSQALVKAELAKPLRQPEDGRSYVAIEFSIEAIQKGAQSKKELHWVPKGKESLENPVQYIVTPYIARNLRNLIRAASTRKHPVLIQGPTSAGKTSMIEYLASRSGNKFVRINNHEHTDLQEYLGSYVSTTDGQLVFQEGVLVQAVRGGHWVVLDELNLAPSDVLEALNRLLDDNRELFIPETQEVVRPHPDFMLFATQNPVGPYGGRKVLSRAFRNRFLELHFDDIPIEELNVILARRSQLPESWCSLIVEVYKRLSQMRQEQRLFEQHSFATLRDLFRWAFRGANSVEELADNGYMLLAEKVRKPEDRVSVKEVIEQILSRKGVKVRIDDAQLYSESRCPEMAQYAQRPQTQITWTKAMRRLFTLVAHAIRNNEPVLLVGETGCGKTTVCQMLAAAMSQTLHIVNAHQNTDTGDLIGAQRPVRGRATIDQDLLKDLRDVLSRLQPQAHLDIDDMLNWFDALSNEQLRVVPTDTKSRIKFNRLKRKALFEWSDGSLVQAMHAGQFYLLDEISLAEDSVLERMNSVLDPQRSILLAEKGTHDSLVTAQAGFQFFATMNPGGDFGKKELSPALRNRFTEIWVPPMTDMDDVLQIVQSKLKPEAGPVSQVLVSFAKWFSERYSVVKASNISIRDILAWTVFVNSQDIDLISAVIHGAALVYIDTLGANPAALLAVTGSAILDERRQCLEKLSELLGHDAEQVYSHSIEVHLNEQQLRIGFFSLPRIDSTKLHPDFQLQAPTTKINAMRIVRALQLSKPILLEGSPGVGKTSIVVALTHATGRTLTRMNLSEQTDLMDLFGSDVPIEGGQPGQFAWQDAPFLTAMKRGDWVLLDEMNLASQSVLEGLNACLDHRGEIYVAELGQTFSKHPDFRLFAAQNPHHQGGGRKGLPASFVNRFTVVYADMFKQEDLQMICTNIYPMADAALITELVSFVVALDTQVSVEHSFGARGSPWEFNLRDALRCLELLTSQENLLSAANARDAVIMLFAERFRSKEDAEKVEALFHDVFMHQYRRRDCYTNLTLESVQIGLGFLRRSNLLKSSLHSDNLTLRPRLPLLETLMICVQQSWPVILVGSSGCGKTSLLQLLATAVGVELEVFSLNADIDATDLVGGFEQADPSRQLHTLVKDIEQSLRLMIASQCYSDVADHVLPLLFDAINFLLSSSIADINPVQLKDLLSHIAQHVSSQDLVSLIERCELVFQNSQSASAGRFEWIEGTLIRALEQGQWLVLDNANLCSSSVLDRLNSLLEPHGSLIVSEHPHADGTARIIKPHVNFRIFMTMDPQYGEVSRAMRNRAVELYVTPLDRSEGHTTSGTFASEVLLESRLFRYQQFLNICNQTEGQTMQEELIETAHEVLSFEDKKHLASFARQAEQGLIPTDCQASLAHIVSRNGRLGHANEHLQLASLQYYERTLPSSFMSSADIYYNQSIHTLSNQPLVNLIRSSAVMPEPYWLARIFEVLQDAIRMSQAFTAIQNAPMPTAAMTRLDRSIAAARVPDALKDSTYWVAPFLANINSLIVQWVQVTLQSGERDMNVIKIVTMIKQFWWALVRLCSTTEFEEAIFQVYLSLGSRMVMTATADHQLPTSLVRQIAEQFKGFRSGAQLTGGLSMERIWHACKPKTLLTWSRLEELIMLEHLADRFDEGIWRAQASSDELFSVYGSIADALTVVRDSTTDVSGLIKDLNVLLAQLDAGKSREIAKVVPYFGPIFEALCQYHDLDGSNDTTISIRSRLNFFASRTTKSAYSVTNWSQSAKLLDNVARYAGPVEGEQYPAAVEGDMLPTTVQYFANLSEATLKQQNLLKDELKVLGASFATLEPNICSSQSQKMLSTVISVAVNILDVHTEVVNLSHNFDFTMTGSHILQALQSVSTKPSYPESDAFVRIAQHNFSNLFSVGTGTSVHQPDAAQIGYALIRFSVGCLLLYVPNRPFDPALRAQIQAQFHKDSLETLQIRLEAISFAESLITGRHTNLRCDVVRQDIEQLGEAPPVQEIARPSISQLNELQSEFANILRLVERLDKEVKISSAVADNALVGISRIIKRLQEGFRAYEDITSPIVGFLSCLKIGLRLLLAPSNGRRNNLHTAMPIPFGELEALSFASIATEVSLKPSADHLPTFALCSSIENIHSWTSDWQHAVTDTFDLLYDRWKLQLTKDQKQAAEASSIFHYKGSAEDEQELDDDEFQGLFPSFEEGEKSDASAAPSTKEASRLQKSAAQVASLHLKIFQPMDQPVKQLENLLISSTASSSGLMNAAAAMNRNTSSLPAIILRLQYLNRNITASEDLRNTYNAYTDANVREAQRITQLVDEIRNTFTPVLEAWPEHATLHLIFSICDELLYFRHVEPVMKILTKAEKLHDAIAEWQTVASREYSRIVVFNKLTDLIVSWRQLELSTWAKLLDLEAEKAEQDALSWWFIAYESVIANPRSLLETSDAVAQHARELVATLEIFMRNSAVGQYEPRLRLLRSLHSQLQLQERATRSLEPIRRALENFLAHFGRFTPAMTEFVAKGRKELEKQLRNVIQLASWKDRNINVLKQSAKSSHRKLFRVIRKFRALLAKPCAPFMSQEVLRVVDEEPNRLITEPRQQDSLVAANALSAFTKDQELREHRPIRFKEIGSTVSMMRTRAAMDESWADSVSRLSSFVDDLQASISHLQKATPATLTTDNTPLVKNLTAQKRRLFLDTLKHVREMGMKSNISSDVLATQDSLSVILSRTLPLHGHARSQNIPRADSYLHRLLDVMPAVRASSTEHSDDLNQAEVVRSVGYMESLLQLCLQQRQTVAMALGSTAMLESIVVRVEHLWSEQGCQVVAGSEGSAASLNFARAQLNWLPVILQMGIKILSIQAEFGQLDFSQSLQALQEWLERFEILRKSISALLSTVENVSTVAHIRLLGDFSDSIEAFREYLNNEVANRTHGKLIMQHILVWVDRPHGLQLNTSESAAANGNFSLDISEVVQKHYEALDMILGSVQDVSKAQQQLSLIDVEETNWLLKHDKAQTAILTAFHPDVVAVAVERIASGLHKTSDPHHLQLATASLVGALPILQEYLNCFNNSIWSYTNLHATTCEVTYKLAKSLTLVANQGFCKPVEKSNDKSGKSEKLEEGTGLGEGEGAEDISKDVGADEDMTDLAQDIESMGQEKDMQKAEDAIDIEDEMVGGGGAERGDVEDEGEKDGEKSGDEEGRDEVGSADGGNDGEEAEGEAAMGEDVGSVDDLGPSAVDEKLWDQAGDENAKEQEGQQDSKQAGKDEKTAAGKEEKSGGKEKETGEAGEDGDAGSEEGSDLDEEMIDNNAEAGAAAEPDLMNPHLQETEGLELPEELQLDGEKGSNDKEELGDDMEEDVFDGLEQEVQAEYDMEDAKPMDDDDLDEAERTEDVVDEAQAQELDEAEINTDIDNPEADKNEQQPPQASGSGNNNDDAFAEQNNEQGGTDANDNTAQEQPAPQLDVKPDTSAEDQHDGTEDQSTSAANARRSTGAETQKAENRQDGSGQQDAEQQATQPEESRDAQTIKKLGSVLEKWHRQQRDIRHRTTETRPRPERHEEQQEDVDMAGAEFEHLPDEEAEADTQALGAATKEQAVALDESMAVEREEMVGERVIEDGLPEELERSDEEEEEDYDAMDVDDEQDRPAGGRAEAKPADQQPQSFVSTHGPRSPSTLANQDRDDDIADEKDSDNDLTPLSSDLSTIHLTAPRTSTSSLSPNARWALHTTRTHTLSLLLTEHLRLILAPTQATKLRGDFRTGKRLNMKRIIPYIASQYKRDRIWLRREAPSKRTYQILLALDDSRSMGDDNPTNTSTGGKPKDKNKPKNVDTTTSQHLGSSASTLAFDTLALISRSLSLLESGDLGVLSFGTDTAIAHPLGQPFSGDAGANVLSHFTFTQQRTDVKRLIQRSIEIFREARTRASMGGGGGRAAEELWQLELVVSDGICEDHEGIRRLLVQAIEERIMVVFIIVDAVNGDGTATATGSSGNTATRTAGGQSQSQSQSILDLERVEFLPVPGIDADGGQPEMRIQRKKYLDTFPFGYYLVVKDVKELPGVLATALRQWFAEVVER